METNQPKSVKPKMRNGK